MTFSTHHAGYTVITAPKNDSLARGFEPPPAAGRFFYAGLAILVLFYATIAIATSDRNDYGRGDIQTQMIAMVAGKNFAEQGFFHLRFTPLIAGKSGDYSWGPNYYYTHFPPLPYYLAGAAWKLGAHTLFDFKLLNILMVALFLAGAGLALERLFGQGLAILATAAIAGLDVIYVQAQLTPMVIADALKAWMIYALIRGVQGEGRQRRGWLTGAWLLLALNAYSTLEYIVALQIIAMGVLWIHMDRRRWRITFLMGLAPVTAMGIHFLNNVWVLGGLDNAIRDMTVSYQGRTVGNAAYLDTPLRAIGGLAGFPRWLFGAAARVYTLAPGRLQALPIGAGFVGLCVLAWRAPGARREMLRFALMLAVFHAAEVSFWCMFPQLTTVHIYTNVGRDWMMTYGLLIGGTIWWLTLGAWRHRRELRVWGLAAQAPLLLMFAAIPAANAYRAYRDLRFATASPWYASLDLLRAVSQRLPENSTLESLDRTLVRAAFYYQPQESFGIRPMRLHLLHVPERALVDPFLTFQSAGHYLLAPNAPESDLAANLDRFIEQHLASFTPVARLGETRPEELAPSGTAVSDSQGEQANLGPFEPAYSCKISVIDASEDPSLAGASRYCVKLVSAGAAKSGIQNRSQGQFAVQGGQRYQVQGSFYCADRRKEFRIGLAGPNGVSWATDPQTGSFDFGNEPGRWTQLRAVATPSVSTNQAYVIVLCNETQPTTWFFDDLRISDAGGWTIYQIHSN